jgi:hypothetical protein
MAASSFYSNGESAIRHLEDILFITVNLLWGFWKNLRKTRILKGDN